MKKFTLEELAKYDGRNGRPAYIAYKGRIYDVSGSDLWEDGDHQGLHEAGKDLTEAFGDAPHDDDLILAMPVAGELAD